MKSVSKPENEKGAVLLTTLLVMSVMAALAVAILDDVRISVKRSSNMSDYAQADWYVSAAEEFIENHVGTELSQRSKEELNIGLSQPIPLLFPIEDGAIDMSVRDGSHCLVVSTIGDGNGPEHLRRLLEYLEWPRNDAANFVSVIRDWQDEGSQPLPGGGEDFLYLGKEPAYRTPNRPIVSLSELRAIDGMTEDRFQTLRPFLCVGDGERVTQININTISPSQSILVASILGDDQLLTAERLIVERPSEGYSDDQLQNAPAIEEIRTQDQEAFQGVTWSEEFATEPSILWVEADIAYRQAQRTAVFEFVIDNNEVERTYRRLSAEARRPYLRESEE